MVLSGEIVSCRVFKLFFIGQKIERHVFVQRIDTWISTHWFELATNRRKPSTLKSQTGACSMCYFSASHGKSSPTVLRSHGYQYKRCRIFLQSRWLDRSTLTPRKINVNALILKTSSKPPSPAFRVFCIFHIFFNKEMLKNVSPNTSCSHVIQSSTPTIGQRYNCQPTLT